MWISLKIWRPIGDPFGDPILRTNDDLATHWRPTFFHQNQRFVRSENIWRPKVTPLRPAPDRWNACLWNRQ